MRPYTLIALAGAALAGLAGCASNENGAGTTREASPVEQACMDAVQDETGVGGLTVRKVAGGETGTVVTVNVPGAKAPWECYATSSGTVTSVRFSDSDGAL